MWSLIGTTGPNNKKCTSVKYCHLQYKVKPMEGCDGTSVHWSVECRFRSALRLLMPVLKDLRPWSVLQDCLTWKKYKLLNYPTYTPGLESNVSGIWSYAPYMGNYSMYQYHTFFVLLNCFWRFFDAFFQPYNSFSSSRFDDVLMAYRTHWNPINSNKAGRNKNLLSGFCYHLSLIHEIRIKPTVR